MKLGKAEIILKKLATKNFPQWVKFGQAEALMFISLHKFKVMKYVFGIVLKDRR